MKKWIGYSLVATTLLHGAGSYELDTISVEEKINTTVVKDVSGEELKSADLAEALMKSSPSISIVRRSGIANDIILRGAKKDNINVLVDNSKIYGACPNRMDPTTSHVLTNNIENVEVIEGPYDVENFGTLSGLVRIQTKEPTEKFGGDVNVNFGSFGYKKFSATVNGGTEKFKLLISASKEKSDQYKDGNGNNYYEQQVENGVTTNLLSNPNQEAYEKQTLLTKAIVNIDDSSEIGLSYTLNQSDKVLYPAGPMDADYDDSDIYTLTYTKRNLSQFSKVLDLEYYYSKVDHPMSTTLRANGAAKMTNHMKSKVSGLKVKNAFEFNESLVTIGLDGSNRNWEGYYHNTSNSHLRDSISDTDTKNRAIFTKYEKTYGAFDIETGARYDNTDIESETSGATTKEFNALSANIFGTYHLNESTKVFAGFGKSSRVPDARELYFVNSNGTVAGNSNLEQTTNKEFDVGVERMLDSGMIKTKLFYSNLDNYIYNNGTTFVNTDAKIYGVELSGLYLINDNFDLDYGVAYQRGTKDPLAGQTDKDLGEIPPLKANVTLNYESGENTLSTTVIAAKSWSNYDSDNGEVAIGGYAILNMKYNYEVNKNFDITLGMDNVFDKTYATTNTYKDIKYVAVGGDPIMFNDPGRYSYMNLRYKF